VLAGLLCFGFRGSTSLEVETGRVACLLFCREDGRELEGRERIETVLVRVGVGSLRVFVLSAWSRFFAVFCFLPYFVVWWKIIDRRRSARSPYFEGSDKRPNVAPVNQTALAPHSNMHIAHRKQHGLAEGRPRSKEAIIMKRSRRIPDVAADPARGSRSKPRVSLFLRGEGDLRR
jgi:hypothetical protein